MEMLSLSNVEKRFGTKQVLKNVTFSVPEHTIYGFVGQNGAGKTTTMKLILGLLACDKGEIQVGGIPVHYGENETNRLIGYLPDVPEFYTYMTPREYLRFCGEITGMETKEIKNRSEELLELVGLGNEKRRIKGFSRGMKQRLGIAQALLNRPKLLICDEPTSALDPAGRKELLDILVAAKKETTVLFSTHILSDVEHICDELAFLHKGEIALQGTLEEVRHIRRQTAAEIDVESQEDAAQILKAFPDMETIGNSCLKLVNPERLPALLHFLADHDIPPVRIQRMEPTLEDLFLEVIGK